MISQQLDKYRLDRCEILFTIPKLRDLKIILAGFLDYTTWIYKSMKNNIVMKELKNKYEKLQKHFRIKSKTTRNQRDIYFIRTHILFRTNFC